MSKRCDEKQRAENADELSAVPLERAIDMARWQLPMAGMYVQRSWSFGAARPGTIRRATHCAFFVVAFIQLWGCQQAHYAPQSLPRQFVAAPTVDVNSLNLASLASHGANTNQIQDGDALEIVVATGAEGEAPTSWPLRVGKDGTVDVPLVGTVQVAGLSPEVAQSTIRMASINRGIYRSPSVAVNFSKRRTNRVTVLGAVENPDVYELPVAASSLFDAIAMAGGLTEEADIIVEVHQTRPIPPTVSPAYPQRAEETRVAGASFQSPISPNAGPDSLVVQQVNLLAVTAGQPVSDRELSDGAIVTVRKRPARYVQVIGLVNKPSRIELPPNKELRLLGAIAEAGGLTTSIARDVLVVRQLPGSIQPIVIKVSLSDAKQNGPDNLVLADGDVVSIEETPITFVVGMIQNFVRLGVSTTLF